MKKFIVTTTLVVVGVMVMGCFGRLKPDIDPNLGATRCRILDEYCHWAQEKICCEGLACEGDWIWGENRKCVPIERCIKTGGRCNFISDPCCYPARCTSLSDQGRCQVPKLGLDVHQNDASSEISTY
uniref:Uncharacterized protein n=1 Tax=Cannabis sativa TaxID=3483 RepID=A0A803Q8U6_CANSA